MAVLQTIRKRSGLLLIIIGVALLAFVMGDFMKSDFHIFGGSNDKQVAVINNEPIKWTDYNQIVNARERIFPTASSEQKEFINEQIWVELMQETLMAKEYATLGIVVSEEEVTELSSGANPHPIVKRNFSNPKTGQFNRSDLLAFLNNMESDPKLKASWLFLEDQLRKLRAFEKYNTLISKGLGTTTLEAQLSSDESSKKVGINFVSQSFSSVADSTIAVTEEELKEYYNEHKKEFKQTESRDIEYVIFDVLPTEADDQAVSDKINNVQKDFADADSTTVRRMIRLESNVSFDPTYHKDGDLSEVINDFMFKGKIGDTYGPYFEDDAYKLSKLMDIKYASDSAKARHILLQLEEQTSESYQKTLAVADSLKERIENGESFAMLAVKYSKDQGSAQKGGELGWFKDGQMVKPFQDACFFGKKGDVEIVTSEYGVHVIQIQEKGVDTKRVQVASIVKTVKPSRETRNMIYRKATEFSMQNTTLEQFRAAAEKDPELELRTSNNLTRTSSYIPDIETPKEVLGWAFYAEKDEVSQELINIKDNKFVIVAVTDIKEKGIAPFEQEKSQIEFEVIKEKKAQMLKDKIATELADASDINDLASKLDVPVEEALNISTYQTQLKGKNEPKVAAYALNTISETLSEPIIGENGVYVVKVSSRDDVPSSTDVDQYKKQLQRRFSMKNATRPNYPYQDVYTSAFYEVLKKNADIEDNRLSVYNRRR